MTEREEDELDLFEARKALQEAEFAKVQTTAMIGAANRASAGIRTIVQKNGYVERFRQVIQGT